MAERRYWISFDLGLQGQYDDLYAWLDKLGAKECGDAVATFRSDKSRSALIEELKEVLSLERNPRVYIISMPEGGRFMVGKRKVAPWTGYAQTSIDSGEEK
jgi:hypothetical protein